MSAGWQVRQRRLSCRVSRIKALSIGLSAKRGCGQRERKIAAILPCGIAFYTKSDGQVYASKLNLPLLGRILGGNAALLFPRNIEPDQLVILERAAKKTSK